MPARSPLGSSSRRNSSVRVGDVGAGPLDRHRGRLGEGGDVEGAQHREVVVADQADVAALAHEVGAGVRLDPVAEHVAEAPDLLDAGGLDLLRAPLRAPAGWRGCRLLRQRARGQRTSAPSPTYDERDDGTTDPIAELRSAVDRAALALRDGEPTGPEPTLERPPKAELGDYSSNAAMLLAAPLGENPRDVAGRLAAELGEQLGRGHVERIEVAGPGFVNLFLADDWYRRAMASLAAAAGRSARRRPTRRSESWSSSSPPTRPARCTSAAAATPPTATPWSACSRRSGTRSSASSTSTTPAARSIALPPRSPPACSASRLPEDGYEGAYVGELGERIEAEGIDAGDLEAIGNRGDRADAGGGAGHARSLRRPLRQLVLRARPLQPRRGRRGPRPARAGGAHLPQRRGALAAHDDLRRRQGPGADPRQRRTDLPRRRRRLPLGQARAGLRAADRHARRRPPWLRRPAARGDRRPRRRPRALRGADHAPRPHRRTAASGRRCRSAAATSSRSTSCSTTSASTRRAGSCSGAATTPPSTSTSSWPGASPTTTPSTTCSTRTLASPASCARRSASREQVAAGGRSRARPEPRWSRPSES